MRTKDRRDVGTPRHDVSTVPRHGVNVTSGDTTRVARGRKEPECLASSGLVNNVDLPFRCGPRSTPRSEPSSPESSYSSFFGGVESTTLSTIPKGMTEGGYLLIPEGH